MAEYKKIYTQEEVDELVAWARNVSYEGRLDIGGGQVLINTKTAVTNMACQVEHKAGNPTYSGMIHKLYLIRECLQQQLGL